MTRFNIYSDKKIDCPFEQSIREMKKNDIRQRMLGMNLAHYL